MRRLETNFRIIMKTSQAYHRGRDDGVWMGLRGFEQKFDVRFACRSNIGAANDPMTVDLSFYNVDWYREWTTGADGDSCFEEDNGQGATLPYPVAKIIHKCFAA